MNVREKCMKNVLIADFEVIEANLYLDAYPDCPRAMEYFCAANDRAAYLRKELEDKYGPLTATSNTGKTWRWIDSPWPWKCEG